jgi:DNA-binding MarR family transcriptional regulator
LAPDGAIPNASDCFVAAGLLVTNDLKYVNMTDINFKADDTTDRQPGPGGRLIREPLTSSDSPEVPYIELLFFAYRDFTSDPDAVLGAYGFGRAHHRVVHFVNRHPGIRVADLLDILKITKQSLGRVLKQLLDGGFIEQVQGPQDRRQRLLYPTEAGRALALRLLAPQERRIGSALDMLTAEERRGAERFLRSIIDAGERDKVARLIGQ